MGWRDRAFRPEEVIASGNSGREVSAAHDADTLNSHKAQQNHGKAGRPGALGPVDHTYAWTDSPSMRARWRKTAISERVRPAVNVQRPGSGADPDQLGAAAGLRVRPTDDSCVIPDAQELTRATKEATLFGWNVF